MTENRIQILGIVALIAISIGCNTPAPSERSAEESGTKTPSSQPAADGSAVSAPPQAKTGVVLETMNAATYTYVQIQTATETIWVAAPEFSVQEGDTVTVPVGMAMRDFHSDSLDRDFELIYFANHIDSPRGGSASPDLSQLPAGHPPIGVSPEGIPSLEKKDAQSAEFDLSGIEKASGGHTVEEIFAGRAGLVGQEVSVRGKVVKYSAQIMGKNWLHLRDGTGEEGSNDLTVTTSAVASVGDVVVAEGILAADRDFGFGYKYELLLEDARVTVEKP